MTDHPGSDGLPTRQGKRSAARRKGASDHDATPRMEHVRVTAPDLAGRAAMLVLRTRARWGEIAFALLFIILVGKLALATVIAPLKPNQAAITAAQPPPALIKAPLPTRAEITDRHGVILAVSLPGAAVYANPTQIGHPNRVAQAMVRIIPTLDASLLAHKLSDHARQFAYIDRTITASQELAINQLGIPGINFQNTPHRHYPAGDLAAHILGGVTPDQRGIAGIESFFDQRLAQSEAIPLRLSIDIGAEGIVRKEILRAMHDYQAKGACGIVISAR